MLNESVLKPFERRFGQIKHILNKLRDSSLKIAGIQVEKLYW